LLGLWRNEANKDRRVGEIMRPAYFVPESKRAGDLLEELQHRKVHMAIVIDEYGGTSGLVTIEDLLEEIVGEIQDEYDSDEEAEYQPISDDEYLFDAGISLVDVNALMNVHLSTEESDTLGGYVLSMLGKVPLVGESFQAEGVDIKVESITGRRILRVRIKRLVTSPHEAAAEANAESNPPGEPDHEMPDMTKRTSDA
jgi:CBS domain containing-hemolysin-like protein